MQRLATAKQFLTCKDTAERTDSRWIQAKPESTAPEFVTG
jgi:hypothetical protein